MSALPIIITTAGLNALVNAQNTGVSNVVIASLGVSPTQIAATAATNAIPGEIKRIPGVSGQVVADDQIYISAADQTEDTYVVRTIGLYLDSGVLFAVYSQAAPLLEKAGPAMAVLEAAIKLSSPQANAVAFTGGGWLNPQASETAQGVLRLATEAEAKAGVVGTRAITPFTLVATLVAALNDRLGVGAPSAFIKGLLTTASAAAFRLTLGLKGAALKDEGVGNGLDADLLDGQHGAFYRAWPNLTDVPATFPPSGHSHGWTEVTGKPATFQPTPHTHPLTDLGPFFRAGLETGLDLGNAGLENVRSARIVAVNNGANAISLSFRLSNGDGPVERALLEADGALYLAGSRVWTAALFNPTLKADLASPALTGTPTAPTAAAGTNTSQLATTAYVSSALATGLSPKANLASPALTGMPTAPTAAAGTNTSQLATTAFVGSALAIGLSPKADLASPALIGTPTAPTAAAGTNTVQLATTAFVQIGLNTKVSKAGDKMTGLLEMPQLRLKEPGTGNANRGAIIQSKYYGDDQYGLSFVVDTTTGPAEVGVLGQTGALYLNGARTWTTALLTAASAAETAAGGAVDRFVTPAGLFSFARSLGSPGYAVIPGTGLMIQWGISTGGTPEGEAHAYLPTAFGGGCVVALALPRNPSRNINTDFYMQVAARFIDRVVFFANRANGSSGNLDGGFEWIALGKVSGTADPAYSAGGTGGSGGLGGGGQVQP